LGNKYLDEIRNNRFKKLEKLGIPVELYNSKYKTNCFDNLDLNSDNVNIEYLTCLNRETYDFVDNSYVTDNDEERRSYTLNFAFNDSKVLDYNELEQILDIVDEESLSIVERTLDNKKCYEVIKLDDGSYNPNDIMAIFDRKVFLTFSDEQIPLNYDKTRFYQALYKN
jgi:hypothetical protein